MGHSDFAAYAFNSMMHRSLRSWLTILGIVIGIAAIVMLISIGFGLNNYISSQLQGVGSNFIAVSPGSPSGSGNIFSSALTTSSSILTTNDVSVIKSVGGVENAYGMVTGRKDITYRGETLAGTVDGVNPGLLRDFAKILPIDKGRTLTDTDSHVAVIGRKVANNSFETNITVGRSIVIENTTFRVVGILGDSAVPFIQSSNVIMVNYRDAQVLLADSKEQNEVDAIIVKTAEGESPDEVAERLTAALRNSRHVNSDTQDFMVMTASSVLSSISAITSALSLFLAGIASISLLVGGVGIANTMFMAVTERTREIGVMKAVGATETQILEVFVIESGMMGLIGGTVGAAIGFAATLVLSYFGMPTLVTAELVLFAIAFSFVVGVVSGLWPARRAAGLEPVNALRG